jgi:hypothetical protein
LQDTLQTFLRAVYGLHLWRQAPARWEESNRLFAEAMKGAPEEHITLTPFDRRQHAQDLTDSDDLKVFSDSRFRLEALVSRVDNEAIRRDVAQLVKDTRPALTKDVMDNANAITTRLNEAIGLLIRKGTVTRNGFVAPDQTTRRRLL